MSLPIDSLGDHVAQMRTYKGWSQSDLAERLGYEKTWVSKLERGKRNTDDLPARDLFRLAYVLGVSPWALLTGWDRRKEVDLGLEGVEPIRAGHLWAWAEWEWWFKDRDDGADLWLRYSPHYKPGLSDHDWDQIEVALLRPVEVFDDVLGRHVPALDLDEPMREVIDEFRTAVEKITAAIEAKETK